jgi:hypothetical protein
MSTHVLHPEGATVSMSDGPAGSGWGASISDEASVPKALAGAASHAEALAPLSRVASGVEVRFEKKLPNEYSYQERGLNQTKAGAAGP